MKKRIISLFIAGLMILSLIPSALADDYLRIASSSDSRINLMLDAIDQQNFANSGTTANDAKNKIKHVIFNARFAAIGGDSFNYPNSGSYVSVIDDGTYKVNIRGAKGCFAYANYVTNLIYGEERGTAGLDNAIGRQVHTPESLKTLLTTQAQAGEHIRIGEVHSVAFISADEYGFFCLSYQNLNSTNNIELQYWTYEEFLNFSYYSGYEVYLFNTNTAVNAADVPNNVPTIIINPAADIHIGGAYSGNDTNPFTDVPVNSEYYNAVSWIYNKGITTGVSTTSFDLYGYCTRAQAVTFLWRAANCPKRYNAQNLFNDIDPNAFYYEAVLWASEQGICNGYGDGSFHPNDVITRAQFVTLLWRAKNQPEPSNTMNPFTDVYLGQYYYKAVLWGNGESVIKGCGDGRFLPNNSCTRGQIALFMYRDMK